ncbi:MAG: R3H domain-containing nucleic acid-binding protein [Chthoniobacterales bacterium]
MIPRETLDAILGYLGFAFEIEEQQKEGGLVLQIFTHDADLIIGRRGETLEDLQFLVNRILQTKDRETARVVVDVEHYRMMRDDALVQRVKQLAIAVTNSGHPMQTEPLNSYDRRLVHNAFKDDEQVMTWSPSDEARLKRVTLKLRGSDVPADNTVSE